MLFSAASCSLPGCSSTSILLFLSSSSSPLLAPGPQAPGAAVSCAWSNHVPPPTLASHGSVKHQGPLDTLARSMAFWNRALLAHCTEEDQGSTCQLEFKSYYEGHLGPSSFSKHFLIRAYMLKVCVLIFLTDERYWVNKTDVLVRFSQPIALNHVTSLLAFFFFLLLHVFHLASYKYYNVSISHC